jgi:NADPH:quinone reductase-like Zn-dependent oxidoreductase
MFYFYPYEFISPGITANDLTDTVEGYVCFSKAQADPYSILEYAWSFAKENRKVDMNVVGNQDEATLETLQSVFVNYTNAEFPVWARTRSVLIPATGKKLDFTYWLQAGRAPIVYLVPGLGAPGEVRIRNHAATVNPTDIMTRNGMLSEFQKGYEPPYVPGMEVSGVVDEVGEGVATGVKIGDPVIGIVMSRGTHGAYREQIVLKAQSVARAPAGKSFAEACTLPMNGLTARMSLDLLNLSRGQTIAVTGAAGAYGGYIIQLAKAEGLKVIADASEKDEELIKSLGADIVVRRGNDVANKIREHVPDGVDGLADGAVLSEVVLPAVRDGGAFTSVRGFEGEPQRGIRFSKTFVLLYDGKFDKLDRLRQQVENGTLSLRVAATYPKEQASAAHKRFEAGAPWKNDPWCLGYFVENELPWAGWGSGLTEQYALPIGVLASTNALPAKAEFARLLQSRYSSVAALNAMWNTSLASWNDISNHAITLASPLTAACAADLAGFLTDFDDRYFTIVRANTKQFAPNQLYLGCRFASRPTEAVSVAAKYCDVVSFNIYNRSLDPNTWAFTSTLGKPCVIGEFHFGALDRGMFHPGLVRTGDQADRGRAYQEYLRSVLALPAFVGCHWFQYTDEPLTGRFDGENYNIGMVSGTDTPYVELVSAARQIQSEVYARDRSLQRKLPSR